MRYYERIGLLPEPRRTRGNYRSYSGDHLARLGFIRRARELGFTLDQIHAAGLGRLSGQCVRQTREDPLVRPLRAPDGGWTVDAWQPLEGFTVNAGVRISG